MNIFELIILIYCFINFLTGIMLVLGLPTTAFCIPSVKLRIKSAQDVPQVPAVPRKRFGSADCDTIYYIHLSLCTQPAVPNLFEYILCGLITKTDDILFHAFFRETTKKI